MANGGREATIEDHDLREEKERQQQDDEEEGREGGMEEQTKCGILSSRRKREKTKRRSRMDFVSMLPNELSVMIFSLLKWDRPAMAAIKCVSR